MIEEASYGKIKEILFVINTSNREAYKNIIPVECFKGPFMTLEDILEEFSKMTFYTCKIENKIVGVAALQIESREIGWVWHVYVLPRSQRKGIGTGLMEYTEERAKERGIKRLRLRAGAGGKAFWAINFYTKLGYTPIDKIETPWGFDLVMGKELYSLD